MSKNSNTDVPHVLEALTEEESFLFAILSDESGLDISEFLWYDPDGEDGCFRAWPFQWKWFRCRDPLQIDQAARALSLDTPIPTPDGWTTMGELKVNDVVFDEHGCPTRVQAVSKTWTNRQCYEVCFDDHTSIIADGEHQWLTWDRTARMARSPSRSRGRAVPKVRTTEQIVATLRYGKVSNHAIDVTEPLQTTEDVPLPIDPYYLGYWLGSDNANTSEIMSGEKWVLGKLRRRGFSVCALKPPMHYSVEFADNGGSVDSVLRDIGVLGNKHIPMQYLRASERQRRQLLAGLCDRDGYLQKNGSCEVRPRSRWLAQGIVELLRSLGEKPRTREETVHLYGSDKRPVYRTTWRPRKNPMSLPRKAERFVEPGSSGVSLSQRRIVDVREARTRPVRCITVDSPSHLFLAGEGMIPTHNSVGKTLSIKLRGFAFPFIHPGNEMVITAPELVHLEPIVSLIEEQVRNTRLSRELMVQGRSGATHRPFQMNFSNNSRLMGRIPQRDGRGVKGIHPLWLELDEAQDYPEEGWIELIETLKRGHEGATWRAHGVTRGGRDKFYEHTQDSPDNEWTVHRIVAMQRPTWTDQERTEKMKQYGSRDDPDYRRNVLGLHGDATNPLFVLTRLMQCVDDDPASAYNQDEYFRAKIKTESLALMRQSVEDVMDYPPVHKEYGSKATYWCGMDVGFCVDEETEILTRRGWLHWDEVQAGDESLAINPETNTSEWALISDVFREHRDSVPMFHVKGGGLDAYTTPHHRWYVQAESGLWQWCTTDTLRIGNKIPTLSRTSLLNGAFDNEFIEMSEKDVSISIRAHRGMIWCPKIKHKNWLARRNGSTYFTGNTIDPSEILTFVEQREKGSELSKLKLLSRVNLQRMGTTEQARAILHTIDFYRPRAFAMDKTGNGLPLFQLIQEWAGGQPELRYILDIIKGYNFSEKITVGFDESIEVDEFRGDAERDAGIRRTVLEYASDTLRTMVDQQRLILSWDSDLLKQFQGSTWTSARGSQDQYGRRVFSRGNDHILDAARMAVLGWKQYTIEEVLKSPREETAVLDMFLG